MSFHDKTAKEVFTELQTTESGLSSSEAERRLGIYGPNTLAAQTAISPSRIFLSQFANPLVWVLLAAMAISFLVKEYTDFWAIAAIVVLNAVLGFVQEYRAETAIASLQKLTALKAKVLRDGKERLMDSAVLVPGDIVLLETGDKVPADARLVEIVNLQTQEAALTGESTPVHKQLKQVASMAQVADRSDMVFSGTIVTAGRAKAVITGTADKTELGMIATLIQEAEREKTPLQKKLGQLSVWLTILVVAIATVVFVAGAVEGRPLFEFLLAAIALAVAAIPEGLPAIVTISLAFGVQRMASRNALIRKLPSAETLGSCTVICADKTGTLTANEMTVRKVYVDGEVVSVTGSGYSPDGEFSSHPRDLGLLLSIGALCNNSRLSQEGASWRVFGDPTEAALLVSAEKAGLSGNMPSRVGEIEFTSERKLMTTFHRLDSKVVAYVKGAPDVVLDRCSRTIRDGKLHKLTDADRKRILDANARFGRDALRVLGFAYRETAERTEKAEKDLIFVGLQAMIDPPRPEARDAVAECRTAGIKVIMITGDHPQTALAVANELGITGDILTGAQLETMDLDPYVEKVSIYARVNPEHKIRIIEALQKRGHVVAMTGDGVNDAPALKKADIGIAMGLAGTDVAKDASVMVLADDNFAAIVSAVREGRRIYDNIGQFIEYLLSSNLGEVLTVFGALIAGWTLPVSAIQLLWINLVTDGLPALALGVEPAAPDVMKRAPRNASQGILHGRVLELFLVGLTMMTGSLFLFNMYEGAKAMTVVFTGLVIMQMFNVLNQRSERLSVFQMRPFSNPWLWLAIISSVLLQVIVVHTPLNVFFDSVPLSGIDWLWVVGVSLSVLVMDELIKLKRRLSTHR
ncbi:calcium-translocating P-type ATPase, SERCA-type [Candidatus Woesearchaeota archaeon]|nr:calcium-translocating P-type ATPase, SERCA-type [Candidatus Woesearchaeota archaeon]